MEQNTDSMVPLPDPSQATKLTSWKNEPSLQALKADLDAAKPSHTAMMIKVKEWNDLMRIEGKAKPPKVKGRSQVQPKLVRRQAEWRYSALTEPFLGSNKLFKVTPVTWEDVQGARQNELVLNYQFRTKLNRVSFIDNYVRSVVDDGTGIVRVGWNREIRKEKQEVPVFSLFPIQTQEQADALQQALQLRTDNPRGYEENVDEAIKESVRFFDETGQATYAVQTGTTTTEVEVPLANHPTVEMLNPENIIIDPSCQGDINKAMFAIVSFETCKADLLKEKDRYHNLNKIDWQSSAPVNEPDHATTTPQEFQISDPMRKRVVAYEYWGFWDIEGNGILEPIVATWIGSTLIRLEKNPYPDGKLPFVLIPYMPVKRDMYGEPDAELLGDNQAVLGAVMRGMIDLLGRSANGQRGMPKGMLDALNSRRYREGEDYEYNPTQNPAQMIIEHKFPELPQSALTMATLQNQEAESLTGVKAFAGGVTGESYGDVAAGIRGVLDAASKREMAILRRLAKGMSEIGNKIIAMNAVFLAEHEVVRITNEEFVTIKREDLKGNFDLEVDISTAEVDNQKSQDLGFMLQTIGPNVDQQITLNILAEIADLKRMPKLAHDLRTWQPQPDPVQEQLKQLAVEKAQLENEELRSKIRLNDAQAQKAMAERDNKNLDYLEQESGTKHARDLEKMKAQSQGNQQLEITKALTKPRKEGELPPNLSAAIGYNALTNGEDTGIQSVSERDIAAEANPVYSLGSSQFDPTRDPALNPGIRLGN
ncbi:hypothetical protein JURA_0021 [Escherichia phage vB_Eco_Jura]|nr:hypothetical protein JURA_0021 [Escherichia phage vB_Eco_Jura]